MVCPKRLDLGAFPSGYIPVSDGYLAEYFVEGSGPPLVLVPGLAGGVGLLAPLVRTLARHFQVITYQLRGETCGVCDRQFHFDRLVGDLGEILDNLRLERPGLMGVSFGGAVALDFASRRPHRLGFVAVQGSGCCYRKGLFDGAAHAVLDRMLLPGDNPFVNQFFRLLTADSSSKNSMLQFVVNQCWTTDQSVMAHRFSLLDEFDLTSRIENLRLPVLVINGERDILVTPSEMEGLSQRAPHAELEVMSDAGHFAFVTHPDRLACRLRSFSQI